MTSLKTLTIIFCCALLFACNTMSGMGKDVEKVGEKIQKSADK
ncbi:entericidin A/B family lipoprotein [Aeromonas molluscorum]|uniref:Glucose/sorbosone dehydrogenase family protein n=1 Tax=Aeromonas molluscorum 848 TaxID=1268236 RepID=R1GQ40_9GAMM|nr:glucose/sorbosone dehydrogenase family protein [Aeromonas molluscorum 848]